ncbi:hypothetical protein H4S02_005912, partial [Coemansia sp. RSA 2611]
GTISYRISGEPDDTSYEIDLMSGDPDNAQLVHVFEQTAKPTVSGVNSVAVDVPAAIPEGKYGIRLGLPDGTEWKYSQIFTIGDSGASAGSGENSGSPVVIPNSSITEPAHSSSSSGNSDSSKFQPMHTSIACSSKQLVPVHLALAALIFF